MSTAGDRFTDEVSRRAGGEKGDGGPGGRSSDEWETAIGLEVHLQLRTATKMFCGCSAEFGAPPNTHVCPVCLGLPGALPVANGRAVELGVLAALALDCRLHPRSEFDRKNYFYPDLPKGYQITQFAHPLATGGEVRLRLDGRERRIRLRRLHLEEDAGKSLHDRFPGKTAVDLNRAGVPLAEIVTEPDLWSPEEARAFLLRLKQLLEHFAPVSDCNMEQGSLRVDANLSVRRRGSEGLGTKTEVKNLNSFSFVEKALSFERDRQVRVLESGEDVVQETRLWDSARGETRSMRGKEEATDYRYFPDPDLVPLALEERTVDRLRSSLVEPPHELEDRFMYEYGLSEVDAARMAATPRRAAFFRDAAGDGGEELAQGVVNLVMGPVAAELNRREDVLYEDEILSPGRLRRVAELRLDGTLSSDTATRAVQLLMSRRGEDVDVDALVETRGLAQVGDRERLASWVEDAIRSHPEEVGRYAAGEERLFGFLMGAVMRASGGKADPRRTKELLRERLEAVRKGG